MRSNQILDLFWRWNQIRFAKDLNIGYKRKRWIRKFGPSNWKDGVVKVIQEAGGRARSSNPPSNSQSGVLPTHLICLFQTKEAGLKHMQQQQCANNKWHISELLYSITTSRFISRFISLVEGKGNISLILSTSSLKSLPLTSFDKEKKTNIMALLESHKIINIPSEHNCF